MMLNLDRINNLEIDVVEEQAYEKQWPNSTAPYQYGISATDMLELIAAWKKVHGA